jgi:hypothetical protein
VVPLEDWNERSAPELRAHKPNSPALVNPHGCVNRAGRSRPHEDVNRMVAKLQTGPGPLSSDEVRDFVRNGFTRLEAAFPRDVADACVELLWQRIGCSPHQPGAWTRSVIRYPSWDAGPFRQATNTPRLHAAFDQLVGQGRWRPRSNPGLFVIRFPSAEDPGDAGWHIDGSFDVGGEWWVNLWSRERALLMLFLFTDVGPDDAPTRIYAGSHIDIPPVLKPMGERGIHFEQVLPLLSQVHKREVRLATGNAGDVYLCHPFLVHAASWPHRGGKPRFMAQPGLSPLSSLELERANEAYSPVELAVRIGLGMQNGE